MTAGSVAFKLTAWFIKYPGGVMYTDEIIKRWMPGASRYRSISSQLEHSRRKGFIVGVKKPGDARMYYEAGPALTSLMEDL